LSRAWFNICLWPALEVSFREKIENFLYQEVLAIQTIANFMSFADVSRQAMELYCKLLNRWELLCVDTIYKKIGERSEDFWVHFLSAVCSYPADFARLCFKH
jgi:hypothetical protein